MKRYNIKFKYRDEYSNVKWNEQECTIYADSQYAAEKNVKSLKLNTKNRADIIPEADVKNEFNGRNAIVNRYFDILSNKYRKDSDTEWDLNSLAAKSGWKVSKDKSSALAKGEQDKKIVYAFDGTTDNSALKLNGFAKEEGKSHVEGNAGCQRA